MRVISKTDAGLYAMRIMAAFAILVFSTLAQATAADAPSTGDITSSAQQGPGVVLPSAGIPATPPVVPAASVQSVNAANQESTQGASDMANTSNNAANIAENDHSGVEGLPSADQPLTPGTRSVVFKDEELRALADAIRQYESKKKGGQKGGNSDESGNVYLNSIIENSEAQWVAWVNNNKVKGQKVTNNISLINVSKDKAFFKWIIVDLDNVSPGWRTRASEIGDNHYKINDYPIEVSLASQNVGIVNFALQVNQTFIPQQLAVIEGRLYSGTPASTTTKK